MKMSRIKWVRFYKKEKENKHVFQLKMYHKHNASREYVKNRLKMDFIPFDY